MFTDIFHRVSRAEWHFVSRIILLSVTLPTLALLSVGCGSRSADVSGSRTSTYSADLGTATAYDFRDKTGRLLARYQFSVYRFEETTDLIYLETEWKNRYPFDDEIDQGIVEARTRLIIQARPRIQTPTGSDLNTVKLVAENLVRFQNSAQWQRVPMSKQLRAYLKRFVDELQTEFRTGFRKF